MKWIRSHLTNDSSEIINVCCYFLEELRRRRIYMLEASYCGMSYDLS